MRKVLLISAALVLPMNAMAQTATPAAEGVPTPRVEATTDGYRVAAIAAGAIAGVIVANALTGGMITPVLLAGAGGEAGMVAAMPAVADVAVVPEAMGVYDTVAPAVVTVAGGLIGGYIGNWFYGD